MVLVAHQELGFRVKGFRVEGPSNYRFGVHRFGAIGPNYVLSSTPDHRYDVREQGQLKNTSGGSWSHAASGLLCSGVQ